MGDKNNNYGLTPWRKGDFVDDAKHLDEVRHVLTKQNGVAPGSQGFGDLVPQMRCQQMSVLEVKKDYIICHVSDKFGVSDGKAEGASQGADELDFFTVNVALPHLLQQTHYEEKEARARLKADSSFLRKNMTYVYKTNVTRTATKGGFNADMSVNSDSTVEEQVIIPSYEVGDMFFAFSGMAGGTNVITEPNNLGETEVVIWQAFAAGAFWGKDNEADEAEAEE